MIQHNIEISLNANNYYNSVSVQYESYFDSELVLKANLITYM